MTTSCEISFKGETWASPEGTTSPWNFRVPVFHNLHHQKPKPSSRQQRRLTCGSDHKPPEEEHMTTKTLRHLQSSVFYISLKHSQKIHANSRTLKLIITRHLFHLVSSNLVHSYLSDLISLQSRDLLWQLLVRCVSQTQSAVITVTESEEFPISCDDGRVFEPAGHLEETEQSK